MIEVVATIEVLMYIDKTDGGQQNSTSILPFYSKKTNGQKW